MNHVFKFHYTTVLVSDCLLYIGLSEVYTHRLSGMLENTYWYSSIQKLSCYYGTAQRYVTSHSLATFTRATQILNLLNSVTLEWYNTRELTHSKILAYNHVHKTKSKFKSLGTFTRYLLLKPYATL